jgi:hypothetical protein
VQQDVPHCFNKQHSVNISQIVLLYVLQGVATAAELSCCLALFILFVSEASMQAVSLQQLTDTQAD